MAEASSSPAAPRRELCSKHAGGLVYAAGGSHGRPQGSDQDLAMPRWPPK